MENYKNYQAICTFFFFFLNVWKWIVYFHLGLSVGVHDFHNLYAFILLSDLFIVVEYAFSFYTTCKVSKWH